MSVVELSTTSTSVAVDTRGAQLSSFVDRTGTQILWDAGTQWPWHAPLLFPTIGRVADDVITHRGERFPMPRHGFGRDQEFEMIEQTPTMTTMRLTSSAATRRHYPFDFVLDVRHMLSPNFVRAKYTVTNTGGNVLPVSLGVHPAFRWTTDGRHDCRIEFEREEHGPAYRLDNVLLAGRTPNPVRGRRLEVTEGLFTEGALVLAPCNSTTVRWVRGEHAITIAWTGFEALTVWSPIEPELICVEPWSGLPSPVDFRGEIVDKPGQNLLPPGTDRTWEYSIGVG